MIFRQRSIRALLLICSVASLPASSPAQEEIGGLYGKVTDPDNGVLPGVSLTLGGVRGVRTQVSDVQGNFRFPRLDPGIYSLQAKLDGFSTVEYPQIELRAGRSTSVLIELPPTVGEIITVTAESPLLDDRKVAQGSVLTQTSLETIPTTRDPWALLVQVPGVVQDRVNVGGSESGSQSKFIAPTSAWSDNTYLVDGVEITDMMATGSSPTYYDFDQFTQFELSTGGTEITKLTPGVSINMVTKRGTNELRGSARFFRADSAGYFGILEAAEPQIDPDELGPGQEPLIGNRTDRTQEYGFETGGPAWPDRFWMWGSWGTTEARDFTADGQAVAFQIEHSALKLNAQLANLNSLVASWNNGEKTVAGRGASPSRAPETTLRQRGPTAIYKLEDTHLFSSSLFVSGTWSKVDGGFSLTTPGGAGPDSPEPLTDSDGVRKRNSWNYFVNRPQEIWQLEGSYFVSTGSSSHELKFGARFRQVEGSTSFALGGRQLWHTAGENWAFPPGIDILMAYRGAQTPLREEFTSLWLKDTMTLGSWTVNAGLRWDVQKGENLPSTVQANPAFPELMPAIEFEGNDGGLDFETISPRLGVTYAVGEERKTLLRASYARFVQNLEAMQHLWRVNPLGNAYTYFYFLDGNDNNTWDNSEVDGQPVLFDWWGIDPAKPAASASPYANAPGLSPEVTDELVVAAEHALRPEFVLGANLTWRRVTDVQEVRRIIHDERAVERLATRDDYFLDQTLTGSLPDDRSYTVGFYALRPGLAPTGGDLLINGDRERQYLGATVTATKRLANRWMLSAYLQYGESTWSIPDSFYLYNDPTDEAGAIWNTGKTFQDNDGGVYFESLESLMQSSWSFNINGMYQVAPDRPWGFNVSGNAFGRQGYPLPYYVRLVGSDGIRRSADAVTSADQFRLPAIYVADLRLDKEFAATGNVSLTFSLDAFNILNENNVLWRSLALDAPQADYVEETLAPRIYRLGVRLNWR